MQGQGTPICKIDSCSRHNGRKLESSPDLLFLLLGFVIPAQICSDLLFLHKSVIPSSHVSARVKWSNTKVGCWQIKGGIIFTMIETFPAYFRFQLSKRATASEADRQLRMMTLCGLSSGWMMVGRHCIGGTSALQCIGGTSASHRSAR